jgi:hypothetical protein
MNLPHGFPNRLCLPISLKRTDSGALVSAWITALTDGDSPDQLTERA